MYSLGSVYKESFGSSRIYDLNKVFVSTQHSVRRAADMEVPVWLLTNVSVLLDSQEAIARKVR